MKQILVISKYIGAVATIAGAALWFDAKFDDSVRSQEVVLDSIATLRQDVLYINVEQSFISEDLSAIHDTMEEMYNGIQDNARMGERLIWMERNRDEFTQDQMEILLDEWTKKNLTPITYNDTLTRIIEWNRDWMEWVHYTENTKSYSPPLIPSRYE